MPSNNGYKPKFTMREHEASLMRILNPAPPKANAGLVTPEFSERLRQRMAQRRVPRIRRGI